MKNSLVDLNNHLFQQLERLNGDGLDPDQLANEITRAGAIVQVGRTVVNNGKLLLDATKADANMAVSKPPEMPILLTGKKALDAEG